MNKFPDCDCFPCSLFGVVPVIGCPIHFQECIYCDDPPHGGNCGVGGCGCTNYQASCRPAESEGELKPCPLCHEPKDLQIDQLPGYRPEIVCNNCGIALQGEDVLDAITRWNKRTKEQANAE